MTFKTINNTTPLFEGTDTHALVGHSSYSVTGTNSFSAIHAEVEGQEYTPFSAPATTNGPRRIGRDEFLENENNGNAVGKDEEVPMGDMLLPLLVMAACMILFKCKSIIKNSRAMKKFFSLFVFSLLSVGTLVAQNNYLQNGDIVSISTNINGDGGEGRRYLDNYVQTQNNVNDNCLWELGIENGQYTFKALATDQYLSIYIPGDPQSARLVMADNPTSFSFIPTGNGGEDGKYLCGSFSHSFFYWSNTHSIYIARYWGHSFTADPWNPNTTLYIEKWEKKGGSGGPTGFFTPEKAEFIYAENDSAATEQATPVTFTLRSQIESHYECVTREEILLRRQTETIDLSEVTPTFHWESSNDKTSTLVLSKYNEPHTETGNRAMMLISNATTNGQTSSFYITPQGGSPMGLKQYIYSEGDTIGIERWVDYADRIIAEYTYKGNTYRETMRVVRKAYHEEELPSLVFSINPVTYTFAQKAESVDINIIPTHQHGRVLYNSDNQEINKVYTEGPTPIKLTNSDWTLSISFSNNENKWLDWEHNGDYKIKVKATENTTENNTGAKRSSVLTGTFTKKDGSDIHSGTFTIPLAQRYIEGGIQFHTKSSNDTVQLVHTSERTIYYLPNEEIELRPAESGYSGYMRWYDYKTGMDPYYNENPIDSTTWILSPRAASGAAFSAINTPQNNNTYKEDGRSYGLYAINKAEGGVLDEDNPANPAPKIKGWNYTSVEHASHTIACDMSAYRDYIITDTTFANGEKRILSITEPTLSYRQLFHLKPAEEIANKFDTLQDGEYLEEYHYQAPVGKAVLLATEFRFDKVRSHKSEMCYFYRGSDGKLHRIESGTKWYVSTLQTDGTYSAPAEHNPTYTSTMDYLSINSTAPQTQIYTLILPKETANTSTDLRIARFTVTFVPVRECGPTNEVLITPQRINSEFKRLATIDFNANTNHLPWDESSYGFVYTSGELADNTKYARGASQGVFPFYGEYMLTSQVNKDWARASAKTGNALYVDGTMEPGLVASISANTVICSGQTLYCSAWFCNPTPDAWNSEGNPIFRCNVQGRNIVEIVDGKTTFTPWTDVEAYFVGELPKNSGWQQINFPIVSAHNYDQTRVAIYNFATTNLGNDFMVDDITLYVSQLPIAAYQGKMACRSIDSDHTSAAAVLRIDYSKIEPGGDGFMYYQIYNNSYNNGEGAPVVLEEESAYYHDNTEDHNNNNTNNEYGSVTIPDQHFDPEVYNADKNPEQKVAIYQSVSKFLDDLVAEKKDHGKAYVKTENNGVTKWLLYVAHIIPNTDKMEEALDSLFDEHSYSMRMAYTPNELKKPECNLQTPLHATQQTVFELRNSENRKVKQRDEKGDLQKIKDSNGQEQVVTRFFTHSIQNCANDLYFLDVKVINHLADNTGNHIDNLEAPIYADWLIGDSIDDIYGHVRPTDEEELKKYLKKSYIADSIFKLNHGGYTHGQVTTAIMYDMRRIPSEDEPNPNYYAKTFEELDPNAFLSPQNYTIVKYLHDNELLQMYTPTVHFYLASQDTARYWAFPIAETAKVVNGGGDTIVLKDCNEPRWVTVSSQSSAYFLNITPLDKKEKTLYQRTQIPTVKVVARNSQEIIIPIKEITNGKIKINGTTYAEDATITINNLPSLPEGFEFYDIERSTAITAIDAPNKLEPGETYTMRVAFQEENGYNYPGNNSAAENACRIGFVFFNIEVVPNTLVWTPTGTSMNGWGKNENWKGWIDTNKDHTIDYNTELVEGFVPMSGTNVIIPNLQNPLIYPYIVPEEEHDHYPMTVYHDQHKCDTIYFAAGAHMNNQHLLEYEAAFVDMILPKQGEWYMMSAPLQNMVSGDMFIPHTGTYTDGSIIAEPNPFMVSSFQGTRDNIAAYAFWTAFYNQSVKTWYEDGSAKESTSAEFQQSNGLGNLLPPGGGFQLLGFGPVNKANDTLVVRLPKPDTQYESSSGREVNVDKPNAHLLAFTPDEDGEMTITLTNAIEGNSFIFGNPTMAFINMHEFLHDNDTILQHEFYRLSGSTWTAVNASTMSSSERFLAPMNAVKLVAKENTNELTITLKTSHLTLNNQYNPLSETIQQQKNNKHIQRQVPSQNEAEEMPEILTVYAFSKGNHARTILAIDNQANDYYVQGEDMLFISSGVEGNSTSVVETPVNMYTAAEKTPMMVDVRQGISQIPLAFLMAKNKKADTFELAFYLSPNWTRTCYLLDKVTGQRRRIMNGSIFTLPMPGNHEERYIIEGPDEYIGEEDKPSTPTDFDTQTAPDTKAYKVLHNQQIYILRNGHTYTLTGLEVK